MEKLVKRLRQEYPSLHFIEGPVAYWSPDKKTIFFVADNSSTTEWTTLHELGHALLEHTTFDSDANLLFKEAAAWNKAIEIAPSYGLSIAYDHAQDCLDTYRDWLAKRSTCPACNHIGVQRTQRLYSCFNCQTSWNVSLNRLCRPYRLKMGPNVKSPA